jgi:inner membrane protein
MVVGYFFFRRSVMMIYFTLVTLSHPLLDAMTNGGSGVALFAPFSTSRYFAPWRPIQVSPIGLRFFSERGLEVLASEIVWVWIPAFLVLLVASAYRKFMRVESEAG